ncbi:MAG: tyrosine-type recombinase/integrase [Chloroflexota bacterium]
MSSQDTLQERPDYPIIAAAIDDFQDSLVGKSSRTQTTYASALRRFVDFLEAQQIDVKQASIDALDDDVLERFYGWMIKLYGRDHRFTITTYLAGTRAFFRFLVRRRLAPPSFVFERMRDNLREVVGRIPYKTPRIDQRLPVVVSYVNTLPLPDPSERHGEARLELLRDRALVRTLFCTGMRREEVARMDRSDLQDGYANQALITGKGDKERIVFFDDETLDAIRTYLRARADAYQPLFLRHDLARGKPSHSGQSYRLSTQSIWKTVHRYGNACGISVSPHDFRHTKASTMLNRGAKLSEVQDILGHASPETTKRIYAHYETSHLRDVFDRFSASPEELLERLPASQRIALPVKVDDSDD